MSTAQVTPVDVTTNLPANEKGEITTDQLKASQESINAQLSNPSVRQNIQAELKRMGEHVVGIESDFAEVHAFLKRLDDTGALRDKDGQVMLLAPEWKVMHDVSCSRTSFLGYCWC